MIEMIVNKAVVKDDCKKKLLQKIYSLIGHK